MNSEQRYLQPCSHPGLQFGFLTFCLPHHALRCPCVPISLMEIITSCSAGEREDVGREPRTHTVQGRVPLGLIQGLPLL